MSAGHREGNLEAPTRHPIDWKNTDFYSEESLFKEMERVFDICHGCRRCVSLCQSFPTLFDLVDESSTFEVDGVSKQDYWKVVDHCYLCDLCYMTKCPYVPPHEWNLDFPHLMLRAKSFKFNNSKIKFRDKVLTSTDTVGNLAGIPVVSSIVNAANKSAAVRKAMQGLTGIHADAKLPAFHSNTLRKRLKKKNDTVEGREAGRTTGRIALFTTCYMNRNEPQIGEDFIAVFEHNNIAVTTPKVEKCCGMPKLELGDFASVEKAKQVNIPELAQLVDQGYDLTALVPSCVLMFKQELPLMYPEDENVQKVKNAFYDPFEYLMLRHREGEMKLDFKRSLGKIFYHAACHQRVQNIGPKTKEVLSLIPDSRIQVIERCSGHDGTYAVKSEFHQASMKIVKPIVNQLAKAEADYYGSDCAMAGHQIENSLKTGMQPVHPVTLLRKAYGI